MSLSAGPLGADCVEEVGEQTSEPPDRRHGLIVGLSRSHAGFGLGIGISFASLRRFWAVAARRNSRACRSLIRGESTAAALPSPGAARTQVAQDRMNAMEPGARSRVSTAPWPTRPAFGSSDM